MIDIISLAAIGLAFLVVAATPGPANISNATIAMSKGRKASLVYGLGLSMGLVFWGIVAASGLGAILQSSVYLLTGLKVLGGGYLIWLAYLSFKSSTTSSVHTGEVDDKTTSYLKWFVRGLILNISNPKTVIAWMAALSVGMDKYSDMYSLISAVLVCTFVGLTVNASYSLLFSIGGVMSWYKTCCHWIERIAATLFTLAGGAMVYSALTSSKESI